jgi:hypothetical protein
MPQPDAADTSGRDKESTLLQFVGDSHLAIGRLLGGKGEDSLLDVCFDAILEAGLLAADLLHGQLTALLVQLLEAVEAVAAVTHHFAGL